MTMNFTTYDWWMQRLLPPFAVVIALLMVSRIPYPHSSPNCSAGKRTFAHIVAIVFVVMALCDRPLVFDAAGRVSCSPPSALAVRLAAVPPGEEAARAPPAPGKAV